MNGKPSWPVLFSCVEMSAGWGLLEGTFESLCLGNSHTLRIIYYENTRASRTDARIRPKCNQQRVTNTNISPVKTEEASSLKYGSTSNL